MHKVPDNIMFIITSYINDVNSICPINKAFLFGSYAYGNYKKDSDIDIAFFSKKFNDKNRTYYMKEFLKKILKYKMDIQPLLFSISDFLQDDNDFIKNEIKKNGIEIYSDSKAESNNVH